MSATPLAGTLAKTVPHQRQQDNLHDATYWPKRQCKRIPKNRAEAEKYDLQYRPVQTRLPQPVSGQQLQSCCLLYTSRCV